MLLAHSSEAAPEQEVRPQDPAAKHLHLLVHQPLNKSLLGNLHFQQCSGQSFKADRLGCAYEAASHLKFTQDLRVSCYLILLPCKKKSAELVLPGKDIILN